MGGGISLPSRTLEANSYLAAPVLGCMHLSENATLIISGGYGGSGSGSSYGGGRRF